MLDDTGNEIVTGDDPVICALCGGESSIAMIQQHLVDEHGFNADDLADGLEAAPIIVLDGEPCPICRHGDDEHDENGCHHEGCECPGP